MSRIYTFVPVAFVFLTAAAFSWLYGGTSTPELVPVMPWACLFALEAMLCFPQCHWYESPHDARVRVCRGLVRDPATYAVVLTALLLAVPFFNQGLCRVCDYPKILAGADPEPLWRGYLPFCLNAREHFAVVLWIVPSFMAALAARHALTWRGKRVLLECLVWNAAALAVLGFIELGAKAPGPLWKAIPGIDGTPGSYFSVFGYANMAGCFFMAAFAVSAGLWEHRWHEFELERAELKKSVHTAGSSKTRYLWVRGHYLLVAVLLNFFAALCTLSRAAIMLTIAVTAFWALYIFLAAFTRRRGSGRVRQIKTTVIALGGIAALITAVSVFAPPSFSSEVASISSNTIFERVSGDNQYHLRVAWNIFRDNPLFGVGGWGYRHCCLGYMTPAELRALQSSGGANVHNDWLQFLAEHGAVGFGLMLIFVALLVAPLLHAWHGRIRICRFDKKYSGARPIPLYALPAPATGVFLAAVVAGVHALGDCPFRSPAVLSYILLFLVCAGGYASTEDAR